MKPLEKHIIKLREITIEPAPEIIINADPLPAPPRALTTAERVWHEVRPVVLRGLIVLGVVYGAAGIVVLLQKITGG